MRKCLVLVLFAYSMWNKKQNQNEKQKPLKNFHQVIIFEVFFSYFVDEYDTIWYSYGWKWKLSSTTISTFSFNHCFVFVFVVVGNLWWISGRISFHFSITIECWMFFFVWKLNGLIVFFSYLAGFFFLSTIIIINGNIVILICFSGFLIYFSSVFFPDSQLLKMFVCLLSLSRFDLVFISSIRIINCSLGSLSSLSFFVYFNSHSASQQQQKKWCLFGFPQIFILCSHCLFVYLFLGFGSSIQFIHFTSKISKFFFLALWITKKKL